MIVLLAGMHRSGTSMFARFLHETGVSMGDELYEDRSTNPYGHYEDVGFLELQREELARAFDGEDYLVAAGFDRSAAFEGRARDLLAQRAERFEGEPWGWKDPRTTLFLDFWKQEVSEARVVGMLRSPRAVVSSLCARLHGYFSVRKKNHFLQTYIHYNRALLDHARRHPDSTAIVDVEKLAADPEGVLAGLSRFLELQCDPALFRSQYDPSVMSRFRAATMAFNRRVFREAQALHAELSARAL